MGFHAKSIRQVGPIRARERTKVHAENLAAPGTQKMVVMAETVDLVLRFACRQDHDADAVLFHKQLDCPVDGCDPDPRNLFCSPRKNA